MFQVLSQNLTTCNHALNHCPDPCAFRSTFVGPYMQREMQDKKIFAHLALQAELRRKTIVNSGSLWEARWSHAEDHQMLVSCRELCELCPPPKPMCFLQSLDVPSGNVEESFLEIHKGPGQGLVLGVVTSPEFLTVKTGCF